MMEIKKKRIPDEIEKMLQKQLNSELYSSDLYLAMALWANKKGMYNFETLLRKYSVEEKGHFDMVANYLMGNNACAYVEREPFDTSPRIYIEEDKKAGDVFTLAYNHEKKVTNTLSRIFDKAKELKDYLTEMFIHDMIVEQIEEEAKWVNLYDRYALLPEDQRDYFIDVEIPKLEKKGVI